MRILITGAGGQLGRDLQSALAAHDLHPLAHAELDVTDAAAVDGAVGRARPDLVVHTAAMTDTTRCEREPEAAHRVNAAGARNVAEACAAAGAAMVYVSTNEVFDGAKTEPYLETDEADPINAYGRSKLEGERLVQEWLPRHYVVRTAWLYGRGGDHFPGKVLRRAESGEVLGVTDEIATPTWTRDLAGAVAQLIATNRYGVYHLTNAGQASRYDWAKEIVRLAGRPVQLRAVTTADFRASPAGSTAPPKPPYSVLGNSNAAVLGIELRPWQEALAEFFRSSGGM